MPSSLTNEDNRRHCETIEVPLATPHIHRLRSRRLRVGGCISHPWSAPTRGGFHVNCHDIVAYVLDIQRLIESRPPSLTWSRPSASQPNQPPLDLTDHESDVAEAPAPDDRGVRVSMVKARWAANSGPGLPDAGEWSTTLALALTQSLLGQRSVARPFAKNVPERWSVRRSSRAVWVQSVNPLERRLMVIPGPGQPCLSEPPQALTTLHICAHLPGIYAPHLPAGGVGGADSASKILIAARARLARLCEAEKRLIARVTAPDPACSSRSRRSRIPDSPDPRDATARRAIRSRREFRSACCHGCTGVHLLRPHQSGAGCLARDAGCSTSPSRVCRSCCLDLPWRSVGRTRGGWAGSPRSPASDRLPPGWFRPSPGSRRRPPWC